MTEPKISVHILAKETDNFGKLLFESTIQCLLDAKYAYQIIVIDNGCGYSAMKSIDMMCNSAVNSGILPVYTKIEAEGDSFAALRNQAIEKIDPVCTHLHWIDTDECYPMVTCAAIKEIIRQTDANALQLNFTHFMITPSLYQEVYPKINVHRIKPELKWTGEVHETLVYDKSEVIVTDLHYLHFGYIRPQWQTAIKWLRYDVWQHGHANAYRQFNDDGVTKDYYTDDKTPDQCLDDRLTVAKTYDPDKYGFPRPFVDFVLMPWVDSRLSWNDWVNEMVGTEIWERWQDKREELGSWKATIGWICEESGFKEKIV